MYQEASPCAVPLLEPILRKEMVPLLLLLRVGADVVGAGKTASNGVVEKFSISRWGPAVSLAARSAPFVSNATASSAFFFASTSAVEMALSCANMPSIGASCLR